MEGETAEERVGPCTAAEQTLEAEASEGDTTPVSAHLSAASAPASRCSSPLAGLRQARHVRSGSFQRWRRQMQRAWRWGSAGGGFGGSSSREQNLRASVNLEVMANQKRQWYQIKAKARDHRQNKRPTSLFEHFFIVGLHSYTNNEVIEDTFTKMKTWESRLPESETLDLKQFHGQKPTLEPQILFKYPPVKRVAMRENELPAFCFPDGVKARLIERTPSMSDLNEVVFGQEHLSRDDLSFIFYLKAADNAPLYGICLHVQEIVQRAPGILGAVSPLPHSSCKSSRFLVSAPRCYCLLTRVPFFELHVEMLNSIIAQERLDRITHYVSEMVLTETIPRGIMLPDQQYENSSSPNSNLFNNGMEYAIPIDTIPGLISPSVLPSDRLISSSPYRILEPQSPESASTSEASDFGYPRELGRETIRVWQHYDDYMSEMSESCSDSFEKLYGCFENGQTSPDLSTMFSATGRLHRVGSLDSVYSSVKDAGSDDDEEYELSSKHEINVGDEKVMEWAKANNNEPLQIVCGYHALPLPPQGGEIAFHPLDHLQSIKYCRPGISSLRLDGANDLASAEEALALSIWTTATICGTLSLESILLFLAGALLEKQVIVICPNLGVLSAIVLSIIPLIRPFQWHSLLLPILPRKMLDFLDAPVPYIVGVQQKPDDIKTEYQPYTNQCL
ncbi:hypothetical protein Cni_G18669 [Canna indica]|uniref:UDENN domain-containing protein n=1 Tax=Canna indica TaxID=4628 RepID=A0AAQ3QHT0_9LILI|nr:hypothetical protein Cni_G18669 [Canna indica]